MALCTHLVRSRPHLDLVFKEPVYGLVALILRSWPHLNLVFTEPVYVLVALILREAGLI